MNYGAIAQAFGLAALDTATLVERGEGGEAELAAAWRRAYGSGAAWPPCEPIVAASSALWIAEGGRVAWLSAGRYELRELPGRGGPTIGRRIGDAIGAFLGGGGAGSSSPARSSSGPSSRAIQPGWQARVRRPSGR